MAQAFGGVHNLFTGLNGSGKSLVLVADYLRPLVGATIEHDGKTYPRRIVQGGIPGLVLEHELMELPTIDPETWRDEWREHKRSETEPPREDVLVSIVNWWLWCRPGDVIVVDEAQRVFRPMPSGKRVPMFIEKLETARRYGVQLVYLTPFPMLLHANVRALAGPHQHVRRVWGSSTVIIDQWERCNLSLNQATATKRVWRHDKSAFKLYESSQLHTKFGARLPLAAWVLLPAVLGFVFLAWTAKGRLAERFGGATPQASASASAPAPSKGAAGAANGGVAPRAWPALDVAARDPEREPYAARALQFEGSVTSRGVERFWFGLLVDGRRVATVTGADLTRAGYSITTVAPCSVLLTFKGRERPVTCAPPVDVQPDASARPNNAPPSYSSGASQPTT